MALHPSPILTKILSIESIVSAMKTELGRRPNQSLAPGHERVNMHKSTRDHWPGAKRTGPDWWMGVRRAEGVNTQPLEFPSKLLAETTLESLFKIS